MTQEYIGTKIITAWPAKGGPKIRICGVDCKPGGDHCNGYCKGDAPHAELLEQRDGYSVKYPDGYTSWSPKEVFEAAYLPIGHVAHLPAWRQRLAGELVQIASNVEKLAKFIGETSPTGLHGTLLQLQLEAMTAYRDAVARRIELLNANMGLNTPAAATGD